MVLRRYFPRPFIRPADEELAFAAAVTIVDEDEGQHSLRPAPHVWTTIIFLDEADGIQLANFALEQEEHWLAQIQTIFWTPFNFTDDEIRIEPPVFAGDEETCLPDVPRVLALVPDVVRDDETLSFVIEDADPWQPQLMMASWQYVVFLDDEIRSPIIDEAIVDETWRVLARSWPDWTQPQIFADNELLSIPIEVIRTEPQFRGTIGSGIRRNSIWDYWNRLREEEDLMVLFDFNFDLIRPEPGKLPGDPSGPARSP